MFSFEEIKPFTDFRQLCDGKVYTALPDDWVLGLTDVVDSTGAIAAGRYKAVNMAGAAAISAAMNALSGKSFPYSFGGDGALIAVPGDDAEALAAALRGTRHWVEQKLGLELRAALVPVSEVRLSGHQVAVARFAPSDAVSYAMFSGGGADWAAEAMKVGRFHLSREDDPTFADLTGLSCRWAPSPSRKGVILSLIVKKQPEAAWEEFSVAVDRLLTLVNKLERDGHPIPATGAQFAWPPRGVTLEALTSEEGSLAARKIRLWLVGCLAWILGRTGWNLGEFDPTVYRRYTMMNSDYRKFEDGLRMTLDCSPETQAEIDVLLGRERDRGILQFGQHTQDAAIMTCIVPSIYTNRHFHFLDGIDGGYTAAARNLDRAAHSAGNA
ncbi:DUF3095 domain-containing protein [Limibacillus halophilus]|uniref:DUF3095 domain-containing protein n=1 Tax=Limibacillus halophilus TaxID=1579333 RepID=A0A839SPI4_9PROT|nr:DUF3095 domain-containing protein [Limibacillus halophilus]MBB3063839.1 hypothetical protein [Limibacillus halophilus]